MMIDFISAVNGSIEVHASRKILGASKTAGRLAALIRLHGVSGECFHSSSMDFASEDGFKHDDDAWDLWKRAVDIFLRTSE